MEFASHSFFFPDLSFSPGTLLFNCGHEDIRSKDYCWNGMHRGSNVIYIWQYTLSGCGAILLNGKTHPLPPGTAFFVRVPHEHVYFFPEDSTHWNFLYISLSGCETERMGNEFIRRYGNILLHGEHSRSVAYAKDLFRKTNSGFPQNRYDSALASYEFLLNLFYEQEQKGTRSSASVLLEKVNAYLQEHISDPVSISALADVCHCSRSHFSRLFHAAAKITPQDYLRNMRLNLAVRLLQTQRLTIKETASAAGFEDPSYFCRVFRQHFGMTPEQFRSGKNKIPL